MTQNEGLEVLSQNRIALSELLRPEREREPNREKKAQKNRTLQSHNQYRPTEDVK